MALDQVANFVRVTVDGTHTSGDSTVSLKSGEASELPNVSNGKYNLVWFDSKNHRRPDSDPEAEIVRVNSIDTSADTISVTRGRENTTATAKDTSPATYELFLGPTAKTITDIGSQKLDKNQRYSDTEARGAINGNIIKPEQSIHSNSIDSAITLSSDEGLDLTGPVTGSASISGNGRFVVDAGNPNFDTSVFVEKGDSIDADTLDGIDSTSFLQSSDTIDADTLDGIDSTSFLQSSDTIDADTLEGLDSTDFLQSSDSIDADTLEGLDSTDFLQSSDTINADTLDGIDSTDFLQSSDTIDADTLDGTDSTSFLQSNDSIDADTLDGIDSTSFLQSSDTINADTLDGIDSTSFVQSSSGIIPHTSFTSLTNVPATEIGDVFHVDSEGLFIDTNDSTPSDTTTPLQDHIQNNEPHHSVPKTQVVSLTTSSSQDVNQTTTVNWDEHIIGPSDNAFSHTLGNSSVTVNESGTYKIYANLYTDTSSSRTNPSFRFRVNGSEVAGRSGSAYARKAEGHRDTSTSLEIMRELSSGDTIDIRTFAEASGGTCNLQNRRSIFTIEKLIR